MRLKKGLTQEELTGLEIGLRVYQRIESGNGSPSSQKHLQNRHIAWSSPQGSSGCIDETAERTDLGNHSTYPTDPATGMRRITRSSARQSARSAVDKSPISETTQSHCGHSVFENPGTKVDR